MCGWVFTKVRKKVLRTPAHVFGIQNTALISLWVWWKLNRFWRERPTFAALRWN